MEMGLKKLWMVLALCLAPGWVLGADRHFIYNYESNNLGVGERDLETYTWYQFGRNYFYSAINQSIEFEAGLDDWMQTSLYVNFTQQFADQGNVAQLVTSGPVLDGISNEWKFKLMDSSADAFGLGLYLEPEFEPDDFELETKVIVDKNMGSWLWTFNFLAEPTFDYTDTNESLLLRPSLGMGCFLSGNVFLGFEALDENFFDNQPMRSVFSLGPCIQYSGKNWWAELCFLPQLANLGNSSPDFTDSQRDQFAVATSFDL
jgi:hypothetical protein